MNIPRFLALIGVLAIFLGGCISSGDIADVYNLTPRSSKAKVGESVLLTPTLHNDIADDIGCSGSDFINKDSPEKQEPSKFSWSVDPAAGATVSNQGIFQATKPGKYFVSIFKKGDSKGSRFEEFEPAEIIVADHGTDSVSEKTPNEQTQFYEDRPEGKPVKIFEVGSLMGVQNGGAPPSFTMKRDHWITELWTYHWNDGKGAAPGTISLKSKDSKVYGPWKAVGRDGQNGVKNAYWVVEPKITLPAGTYTVIDSNPATHAQNSETGGRGMAWMHGIPAK